MKKTQIIPLVTTFVLGVCLVTGSASAQENVTELKDQIKALQKRVEELEAKQVQNNLPQRNIPFHNQSNYPRRGGWDPFEEMGRMQQEMNRMFQNSFSRSRGTNSGLNGMFNSNMFYNGDFDIQETKEGYVIKFDMNGLDKDKLNIDVNEHSITISGEKSSQIEKSNPNGFYSSQSFGTFLKTVPLPIDADTAKMETKKENNTLIIRMPKKK